MKVAQVLPGRLRELRAFSHSVCSDFTSVLAPGQRVNGNRTSYAHVGGTVKMLGLCQFDTLDPAAPNYTICPCLYRVTLAEEQCSHCGVVAPLSPASPSGIKEWQDLKPADFSLRTALLWKSCKLFTRPKRMYRTMVTRLNGYQPLYSVGRWPDSYCSHGFHQ